MIGLLRDSRRGLAGDQGRPCRSLPRSAFERLLDFDRVIRTFDPWAAGPILSRLASAAFILRAHGQAQSRGSGISHRVAIDHESTVVWCPHSLNWRERARRRLLPCHASRVSPRLASPRTPRAQTKGVG